MMQKKVKTSRKLTGTVVSDKMSKTVVVEIVRFKTHPKYLKQFKMTSRLKAHDEKQEYKVGDKVILKEVRPLSKEKRWIVVGRV